MTTSKMTSTDNAVRLVLIQPFGEEEFKYVEVRKGTIVRTILCTDGNTTRNLSLGDAQDLFWGIPEQTFDIELTYSDGSAGCLRKYEGFIGITDMTKNEDLYFDKFLTMLAQAETVSLVVSK